MSPRAWGWVIVLGLLLWLALATLIVPLATQYLQRVVEVLP